MYLDSKTITSYTTVSSSLDWAANVPSRGKQAEQACRNSWVEDRGFEAATGTWLFLSFIATVGIRFQSMLTKQTEKRSGNTIQMSLTL